MKNVLNTVPRWLQLVLSGTVLGLSHWWYSTVAGTMKIWRDNPLPGVHSAPILNQESLAMTVTMLVTGFSLSILLSYDRPDGNRRLQFRWFAVGIILFGCAYLLYIGGGATGRVIIYAVVGLMLVGHLIALVTRLLGAGEK